MKEKNKVRRDPAMELFAYQPVAHLRIKPSANRTVPGTGFA